MQAGHHYCGTLSSSSSSILVRIDFICEDISRMEELLDAWARITLLEVEAVLLHLCAPLRSSCGRTPPRASSIPCN